MALGLVCAVPALAGEVKGTVTWSGAAPRLAPLKVDKEVQICGGEVPDESVVVAGGKIGNVVVTITRGSPASWPRQG